MRRSRVRRRNGCPRTKRILGRNGFAFGCHRAYKHKKEIEGARETIRKATTNNVKENKELKVCMHENA